MIHTREEQMEAFGRFLDILDELRVKCPWDRKQTNESLRPNTIEETYELCDALMRDDKKDICKELGDVLLHVAFYAKIGSETGDFDIKDVCDKLCDKLIFRHPHVFGEVKAETAGQVSENWEQLKLKEKDGNKSVLSGVPAALPSLIKAYRIQDKARNVGFDWEEREQVWDKVKEEIGEFQAEVANMDKEKAEAERSSIEIENKAKAEQSAALDNEIADKQKKRDEIRKKTVDGILDSVGSLVGIGKTATLEKEHKLLTQELDRLKKAFKPTVSKEVEKQTKVLAFEKKKAETERDNAIAQIRSLASERDRAVSQLNSQNKNEQLRINNAVRLANEEKDKTINRLQGELSLRKQILAILADMLYAASDVFKRAIDAIIAYGTEKYKSIFGNDEAADIKSVMRSYGDTKEQHQAIGTWLCDYADSRQSFDEIKHRQTYKEVADVANGAYDWKIERMQENSIKL